MNGLKVLVVEITSPTASWVAAATGSRPANGSALAGSLRNSSCQATVRAASHLIAVTATPVLGLYARPGGAGTAAAPPALAPPLVPAGVAAPVPAVPLPVV